MSLQQTILAQVSVKLGVQLDLPHGAQFSVKTVNIRKNRYLIEAGEVTDRVGFLLNGLLRKFRTLKNGFETTTDLIFPGGFAACYADQLKGRESFLSIQAIEDSVVAVMSYAELRFLMDRHPSWTRAGMKINELLYLEKESREMSFLSQSAGERLKSFLNSYPMYAEKIPKQIIASYLGINPSTLSRLIKNRSIK